MKPPTTAETNHNAMMAFYAEAFGVFHNKNQEGRGKLRQLMYYNPERCKELHKQWKEKNDTTS